MSAGIHQVCRTMGIAEAIAITMMVTANNFAMMLRPPAGLSVRPAQLAAKLPRIVMPRVSGAARLLISP